MRDIRNIGWRKLGAVLTGGLLIGAGSAPLVGQWGGDQALLVLNAAGGRLQLEDGHASIGAPVRVDGRGRFNARGTFYPITAGPAVADQPPVTRPARFDGKVEGTQLTLHFRSGSRAPQTFRMSAGRRVKLIQQY